MLSAWRQAGVLDSESYRDRNVVLEKQKIFRESFDIPHSLEKMKNLSRLSQIIKKTTSDQIHSILNCYFIKCWHIGSRNTLR